MCLVVWFVDCLAVWLVGWLVGLLVGWLVGGLVVLCLLFVGCCLMFLLFAAYWFVVCGLLHLTSNYTIFVPTYADYSR